MSIALDATYSLGEELSGVGIYSQELLYGLAAAHPDERFRFCFRPHRWKRAPRLTLPPNCSRSFFGERWIAPRSGRLFHGLNQRMPRMRFGRTVCTFHDLFVMTGEYSSPEFRKRFTQQAEEAAARADLILAVSEFTRSQAIALLRVEASRVRVVHHGIRSLPANDVRKEQLILHVGAIQHRKNVTRLVKAFESLAPSWRLTLAGSPGGYGASEALRAIEASPAKDRIAVTGYVTPDELSALYAKASVFAFPSLDEGFGMPVLEAMSRGIPVLASDRSALPEVCGGAALLVDPLDVREIAHGLSKLTKSEALRDELRMRGYRRAAEFSWEKAVAATWSAYRELLD